MEGYGSIFISWYIKTNFLDDRDAFMEFGTATPPIYSTEPVKEGVLLSAWSVIEDFSACYIFYIFMAFLCLDYISTTDNVELTLVCTEVCYEYP